MLAAFTTNRLEADRHFRGSWDERRAHRLKEEISLLELLVPVLTEPQRPALARMIVRRTP